MSLKQKYPADAARAVAKELVRFIRGRCEASEDGYYLKVCGSLRRKKEEVGDVELVYVPRIVSIAGPADLLGESSPELVNLVDAALEGLELTGIIERRLNVNGQQMWGESNKLAVHKASGIPVDFFATTKDAWWGYIVCRTGPADSNTRIAAEAKRKQWKWHPYDGYFTNAMGQQVPITTEAEAFTLVGLPHLQPWERT